MGMARMGTGDKRVQAFNLMGESMLYQEIQRTIGHRGLCGCPFGAQDFEDVISPKRAVLFQQYLQYPLTLRREPQPFCRACFLCSFHSRGDAGAMIVMFETNGVHEDLLCYNISCSKSEML